ncbi:uncharacterized protein LOC129741234 [Uranotaenia lowii]|uniref:uncharacterized protein LOC129741234 n=1 Tax=Uranotaenia lowii TaxID=190385 RepID=UPI00247A2E3D|nr:uncharacterized protein LOC129741234 [Uranotaenia lowii]
MKAIITLLSLAVAAHCGYVEPTWDSVNNLAWNSWNGLNYGNNAWNNGWNNWNSKSLVSYPFSSIHGSWPAVNSVYDNAWINENGWYRAKPTVVQANVAKVNPWGLPLAGYGYGHGYNNYVAHGAPVVSAKYVAANPGSVHVAPLIGHAVNQKLIVA